MTDSIQSLTASTCTNGIMCDLKTHNTGRMVNAITSCSVTESEPELNAFHKRSTFSPSFLASKRSTPISISKTQTFFRPLILEKKIYYFFENNIQSCIRFKGDVCGDSIHAFIFHCVIIGPFGD